MNVQLIRILTYRLIAHPFLPSEIDELTAAVWKELATHGRISPKVSTKDIYQPRAKLGLGLRHLGIAVHKSFVEAGLRYLNQDGPPASCVAVRDALLLTRQNALQDSFPDAANRLSLRFHAPGPWNPCLPSELRERERLYAARRNAPPCLATVTKVHKKTATICFDTGGSATITKRSNFTFTPPNTPPLSPGDITHYHLFPPFSSPQTRNRDTPFPLQADLMNSTCEGHWFHLPNLRHVLNHEDLMGWGCIQAANLVAELPFDDTAWIYTDGSSGDGGHGSAFAIFWQQQCYVLCRWSPSPTSGGSEQWAMAMALAHLPNILPNTPVVILGDNLDTVEAVNRALSSPPPVRPSTYTQGTRDTAYTSLLAPLPHLIHVAWIKGHAHFMGNELADHFSKWAAQALLWHPSLLPPPPAGVVTSGGLALISKIPKYHTRSLFPTHPHTRLHFGTSASFLRQSSFFSAIAFKWVSGTYGCQDYRPHCDTSDRTCPKCQEVHPMDPISFCALCPTMQSFQQCLSSACPPPFDKLALEWWIASDRGDRRLATRTLVPETLHTTLATSPSGKDPAMHAKDFDSALVKRNRALTPLIEDANKFLHDNPPGAIGPPVTRNNYFDSLGEFSTSRGHAPRDPPKYVPPFALPEAVLTPPKRKASDQPQRKKRPPPRHRPSQQSPAQRSALWTPTCSLLAPVPPPLLPLCGPDATEPRCSTKGESAVNPPPPPAAHPPDPKQPRIDRFFPPN